MRLSINEKILSKSYRILRRLFGLVEKEATDHGFLE